MIPAEATANSRTCYSGKENLNLIWVLWGFSGSFCLRQKIKQVLERGRVGEMGPCIKKM